MDREATGFLTLGIGALVLYVSHNGSLAVVSAVLALATAFAGKAGWLQGGYRRGRVLAGRLWERLRGRGNDGAREMYDVFLGRADNGQAIYQNLAKMGHLLVVGATRFGKTTWMHTLVDFLVTTHEHTELRIGFSDPKRTSFMLWHRIPHLFAPIARTKEETARLIGLALQEMEARKAKMEPYARKHLCDNIQRYYELSGERLPWIVLIFDELADSLDAGSEAYDGLETLIKMGAGYGITLIIGTQRPSAKVLSGEVNSQAVTILCTYMKSAREYGTVSQIPRDVHSRMTATKGRFMLYSPELAERFMGIYPDLGGWGFIQGVKRPDQELERNAHLVSREWEEPPWSHPAFQLRRVREEEVTREWSGSTADKIALVRRLESKLGRPPRPADLVEEYGIVIQTGMDWVERVYGEK